MQTVHLFALLDLFPTLHRLTNASEPSDPKPLIDGRRGRGVGEREREREREREVGHLLFSCMHFDVDFLFSQLFNLDETRFEWQSNH